ncbi:MAG: ATP-dependent DNA helicase [Patescibacteria group bacterium]
MTLLPSLNEAQKQAVTHAAGPLLIVAGAGTGKTTVVTQRIAWLIAEQKIKPDHILALTFTDKAAGELEERVDKLLPMGYVDLWVSTFHSFCERILRDHALDIGLTPDFTLLDETDQAILMRENLEKFELNYYRPLGNPTKFVSSLIKHFSRCKDEAIRPEEYIEFAKNLQLDQDADPAMHKGKKRVRGATPDKAESGEEQDALESQRINEIANAYHTYQQLLFEKGALDFGDLITQALYLFQQRPKILERYRKQFEYILVDEFQDTNWAQYELVKLLASPQNNLTVVGDDDQSIYKFRGASVANILAFKADFPKAAEVVLTENYRSTQNILDLAYAFIQANNPNRLEVQLGSSKAVKPESRKGKKGSKALPLYSSTAISKKLVAQEKGAGTIEYSVAPILEQEATGVVEKIIELKKKKGTSYNDFAILVRANDSAQPFLQRLRAADVPFQFVATAGLYRQPIVLDILNYLKLLDNFHESASLYRILTLPSLGIPLQDVMTMMATARRETKSLFEVSKNIRALPGMKPETITAVEKLHGWLEAHGQLARTQPVGEVALKFLEDSGLMKQLTSSTDADHLEVVNYMNQLFQVFQGFQTRHDDPTVTNFLHELAFAQDAGDSGSLRPPEWEQGPEAVKVMTIHSAKGLEFPYVFIANLVDKRFPTIERRDAIALPDALVREKLPEGDWHLQEERRLMYVAITRAKQGVFFTAAEDYGGARKKKPSRFIEELGLKAKPFKLKGGLLDRPKAPAREENDADVLRKALPPYFSFTQLKAFEKCPKQYAFAHLLKIPVPGQATLSFGQTVHNTLLNFYKLARERGSAGQADLFRKKDTVTVGPLVTWSDLITIYQAAWIDQWYATPKQKADYKARGTTFLKNFYDSLPQPWPQPTELEKGFTIVINGHKLKGKIDRIDPSQGGIEIIDYKTSEKPPAEDKADLEQLHIYAMAAREALGLNPVKLTFIYLAAEKPFTYPIDEKAIEKTKVQIGETIEAILKSDFSATPSKFTCASCDFRNICEDRYRG